MRIMISLNFIEFSIIPFTIIFANDQYLLSISLDIALNITIYQIKKSIKVELLLILTRICSNLCQILYNI